MLSLFCLSSYVQEPQRLLVLLNFNLNYLLQEHSPSLLHFQIHPFTLGLSRLLTILTNILDMFTPYLPFVDSLLIVRL